MLPNLIHLEKSDALQNENYQVYIDKEKGALKHLEGSYIAYQNGKLVYAVRLKDNLRDLFDKVSNIILDEDCFIVKVGSPDFYILQKSKGA